MATLQVPTISFSTEEQQLRAEQKIYNSDPEEESLKYQNTLKSNSPNVLLDIIKQLRPGVELYKIALPSYVLQPISFLEKLSIYSTPSNILINPKKYSENEQEQKLLTVLAWLLSTWRSVPRNGIEEVKPYNPVLGEQFCCTWIHDVDDTSEFIAEQVSHHPPVSAYMMRNKNLQFAYKCWVYPRVGFSLNSFTTIMDGKFVVEWGNDVYDIKYPNVVASGVVFGSTTVKAAEELIIRNKDYIVTVKFDSGSTVKGSVKKGADTLYTVKGNFTRIVHIKNSKTNVEMELYDTSKIIKPIRVVRPVLNQHANESQRNWHKVTLALKKQDFEEANKQKFLVEDRERKKAAERKITNVSFVPTFFSKKGEDWVFNGEDPLQHELKLIGSSLLSPSVHQRTNSFNPA